MLRITRSRTDTEDRWTLHGQLIGPWVAELRACWELAGKARMVVDLSDITFIDESAERLLYEMQTAGAHFVAAGVETQYLLDHLTVEGERALRRCIGASSQMPKSGQVPDRSGVDLPARVK